MLVTFNKIFGYVLPVFSLLFIPHLILFSGVFPKFSFPTSGPNGFPPAIRIAFLVFILGFMAAFWAVGICSLRSARFIRNRQYWRFSTVVAIIQCFIWTPIGTALGVFSLIVLYRSSVKALYGEIPPIAPTGR
jgi:hypothetical protein